MDRFQQIVTVFAFVMTVVGAAAFIWAYYMASLNKNQLEALRGDRDDLNERVKRLEAEKLERDVKIEKLQTESKVLRDLVTNESKINDLLSALATHDANVEQKYTDYMAVTGTVLETTERVLERLEQLYRRTQ